HSQAVVSDMNQPLGKYVGNSLEVYECIKILRNEIEPAAMPTWELSLELSARMLVLTGISSDIDAAKKLCLSKLENGEGLERFRLNIECQGGDVSVCDAPVTLIDASLQKTDILADSDGFVSSIDTLAIGNAVCSIGGGRTKADDKVDHAVGFASEVKIGDQIRQGDSIGVVYCRDQDQANGVVSKLSNAYAIGGEKPAQPKLIREVISSILKP
ncbi:MAG TPA: hypothetical protein VK612_08385, partial [Pyrinomonadaceae bacterium]|nr:hypothetical protein [Pyrinomonadaceae bacterium]